MKNGSACLTKRLRAGLQFLLFRSTGSKEENSMSAKHYLITATVSATANPVMVNVNFDNSSTFLVAFKQTLNSWSFGSGVWSWMGLAGQGSSALVALTGAGVSAQVDFGGAGMNVPVTFTLQGLTGPIATHTTPPNVMSDSFTFNVDGAGFSDLEAAVFLQEFLNPS
jgi:hypothetical protein